MHSIDRIICLTSCVTSHAVVASLLVSIFLWVASCWRRYKWWRKMPEMIFYQGQYHENRDKEICLSDQINASLRPQ